MTEDASNVIDSLAWLKRHVDQLIASDDHGAIAYLERLLMASDEDVDLRTYCLKNLGLLHLQRAEVEQARKYLRHAAHLEPDDPEVHHALGTIAAQTGHWWLALLNFMEAVHRGREHERVAQFMRSAALAMRQVQLGETALSVLLGALERDPNNPYILESLGRFYEEERRWLEAIELRDTLVQVLKQARALPDSSPPIAGLLDSVPDQASVRARMDVLSKRLRQEFQIVRYSETIKTERMAELSRLNYPSGLHTLVHALGIRDRNLPLLKTAQALWAKALHDRFDVHLSTATLAAAIHWIVERLHWRVPTPLPELERLYNADPERTSAAVRLLVSRFEVEFFPSEAGAHHLTAEEVERLTRLQKALLYDVDLHLLEPFGMIEE